MSTDLPLANRREGKVRDVYEGSTTAGQPAMVIVASDRISAYDVVMPNGIPGKGQVLTQIAAFWFQEIQNQLGDAVKHHLISTDPNDIAGLSAEQRAALTGRVMVGERCRVVPIECVVRGYLAGSGWKEYQQTQSVCGVKLPAGLKQCERLPEPIFTPATKAEEGHDENISYEQACAIVGEDVMQPLRDMSMKIYDIGHAAALERGVILADTKFEFGFPLDRDETSPILIDEALTPDSSRFWPADVYEPGRDQDSFDKQYVRNFLEGLVAQGQWSKQPPGPALPDDVVENTLAKYVQAFRQLTGRDPQLG